LLESLGNLIREINAIIASLRQGVANKPINLNVIERIQESVLTWSINLRPGLAAVKVPPEVLNRADALIAELSRFAANGATTNAEIVSALSGARAVLHEQVLVELALVPLGLLAAFPQTNPALLFPEIPDLPNEFVPYSVQGWAQRMKAFLEKNPFSKNVFVMVAYRPRLEPIIAAVKRKLVRLELKPVLARDQILTNDLYNPIACLLCCSYGVAIFDRAEPNQTHNPNVVYELGMMHLLKRPCVLLKHAQLNKMPTDILSQLYEDYSTQREAVTKLGQWWTRLNN
jgi:hypothetical protein